ncbi:MAG: hypothetical protein PHQ11_12570 [Paludibacter sp.]|nr:hypothetical protein [Paludibacter sp.]
MTVVIRTQCNRPKACRLFTDREDSRKVFFDNFKALKITENPDSMSVILYYGIGGIGKSRLLEQLKNELLDIEPNTTYIAFDFKVDQDPVSILKTFRDILKEKKSYDFPIFDFAYLTLNKDSNGDIDSNELKGYIDQRPKLKLCLEGISFASTFIPGAAAIVSLTKIVDALWAEGKSMYKNYKESDKEELLNNIRNNDSNTIRANLPYYFALDINNFIKNTPIVFFFDSYEKLIKDRTLVLDEWIHGQKGLISSINKSLWVIASRDKLTWKDTTAAESLEQHLVGRLSDEDSILFLNQCGIQNQELCSGICSIANGVPLYLDLCVDRFERLVGDNKIPMIDDFGNNADKLIESTLDGLNKETRPLLFLLSYLRSWTDELIIDNAQDIIGSPVLGYYDDIRHMSMIQENGVMLSLHDVIADVILPYYRENYKLDAKRISDKTLKVLPKYFKERLNQTKDKEITPSFISDLDSFVRFELEKTMCNKESSNESDFKEFYNNLKEYFSSMNNARYLNIVKEKNMSVLFAVSDIFPDTDIWAEVTLYHASILIELGLYEKALVYAKEANLYFEKKYGESSAEYLGALVVLLTGYYALENHVSFLAWQCDFIIRYHGLYGDPKMLDDSRKLLDKYSAIMSEVKINDAFEKILKIRRLLFGVSHPDTMDLIIDFAFLLRRNGDDAGSISLFKEVLHTHVDKVSKDVDINMIILREYLADSYFYSSDLISWYFNDDSHSDFKRYYFAYKLYQKLLPIKENLLGKDHIEVLDSLSKFILCQIKCNDIPAIDIEIDIEKINDHVRELENKLDKIPDYDTSKIDVIFRLILLNYAIDYNGLGLVNANRMYETAFVKMEKYYGENSYNLLSLKTFMMRLREEASKITLGKLVEKRMRLFQ